MVGNGTYGQVYKVCLYLFSELKRGVSDCVTRDECVARERAEVRWFWSGSDRPALVRFIVC